MANQSPPIRDSTKRREGLFYRGAICRALALAFLPPTRDSFEALTSNSTRTLLLRAASFLDSEQLEQPASETHSLAEKDSIALVGGAQSWLETVLSLDLNTLMSSHGRLFGHTPRGVVTPYETEYGQHGLFQQPQQLSNLGGFYRAFGLQVRQDERERPDHISCQLEFLEFLTRKQAYALEQGDDSMFEASQRATRLFLKEHLGRFGRAFGHYLGKQDGQGFLGAAGDFLFDFLTVECRSLKIEAGPSQLPLRSTAEDNVPMACGGESDLVELQT